MNDNAKNTIAVSAAAAELLQKLANASLQTAEGKADFAMTEPLSKKENGILTGLKKKSFLHTELTETETGKVLVIHFDRAGLDFLRAEFGICLGDEAAPVEEEAAPLEEETPAAEEETAPVEEEAPAESPEAEAETAPAEEEKKPARRGALTEAGMASIRAAVMARFTALPESGTKLQKIYKGKIYTAFVNADGSVDMDCDIEGTEQTHFNSLTHAARTITGAKNISGRKFFGCAGKRLDAAAPVKAVAEAPAAEEIESENE